VNLVDGTLLKPALRRELDSVNWCAPPLLGMGLIFTILAIYNFFAKLINNSKNRKGETPLS
jgi:hypothetical protein